jgi:hypothetical protein
MEEGPGAHSSGFHSSVPIGDPPKDYAEISAALQRMLSGHNMKRHAQVIHLHYLGEGDVKTKAAVAELSVPQYWDFLHTAHAYLAGFLEGGVEVSSYAK